jgi:hypothetical protein
MAQGRREDEDNINSDILIRSWLRLHVGGSALLHQIE